MADLKVSLVVRRPTTFRLTWTVPPAGDRGYGEPTVFDVRYARAPICDENFDLPVATAIPTGTVAGNPGEVVSVDVGGLYPETSYFFGVAVRTGVGVHGPVAKVAAEPARFNITVLNHPTVNSTLSVDGTADFNGDGLSDLLVGTGTDAYVYFGSPDGYGAPAVHIASAESTPVQPGSFAATVAAAGDLDGDGRPDLAVRGQLGVYVFSLKNRPAGWPAELDSSQADYVIRRDSGPEGFVFGAPLARAGDFDGDGHDDLALGAPLDGDNRGGLMFIVRGGPSFASFTAPDPERAILIRGDTEEARAGFGGGIAALGPYYGSSGSLAIRDSTGLLTFAGPPPGTGVISSGASRESWRSGGPDVGRSPYWIAPFGAPPAGLLMTSPGRGGLVELFTGLPADGLFSRHRRWVAKLPPSSTDGRFSWGDVGVTSQTPGGVIGSWIGDGEPDLLVGHETKDHTWLVLIDGAGLRAAPSIETEVSTDASPGDVTIDRIPTTSNPYLTEGTFIPDCNGDRTAVGSSASDFAVVLHYDTRDSSVVVFW